VAAAREQNQARSKTQSGLKMPGVFYSARALSDLARLYDFLAHQDRAAALTASAEILEATAILERHPLIGRPTPDDLRELVISRGRSGYVALYRLLPENDRVEILAIRHQSEAGYV
jgi:plasmid stabilization system protein ParE